MDPDVRAFADTMVVIGSFIVVMLVVALVANAVLTWTRRQGNASQRPVPPAFDDSRFDRLELAVEAIAIEVERIGEAHRFSTQLLSERLPARLPDPRESSSPDAALGAPVPGFRPSITPH